jgi:hypothetical protein
MSGRARPMRKTARKTKTKKRTSSKPRKPRKTGLHVNISGSQLELVVDHEETTGQHLIMNNTNTTIQFNGMKVVIPTLDLVQFISIGNEGPILKFDYSNHSYLMRINSPKDFAKITKHVEAIWSMIRELQQIPGAMDIYNKAKKDSTRNQRH